MASDGYRGACLSEKGEECDICGETENVVVHHLDGNRTNDSLENLIPLCRTHHQEVHNGYSGCEDYTDQLREESSPSGTPPYTATTIRIDDSVLKELESTSDELDITRSELIRRLIDQGLNGGAGSSRHQTKGKLHAKEVEIEKLEEELEYVKSVLDKVLNKV